MEYDTVVPAEARTKESALSRTQSYLILPFHNFVSRTVSVPDITGYYRGRRNPRWISRPRREEFKITWPVTLTPGDRYSTMTRNYWRDRYFYFSPLYKRQQLAPRPFQSDVGLYPYTYFVRYNGFSGGMVNRPHYNYPIEDYYGF